MQAGLVYTLLVDIGCRNDAPCLGTADLLINGNQYAASGVLASPGNWSTFTATYIATGADVGSSITIELGTTGFQGNFDNVQLSSDVPSATPEPVSMGLVGVALAGIAMLRMRNRA